MQKLAAASLAALLVAGQLAIPAASHAQEDGARTATPIKHVVVIFGENISFDHYFGTYPYATESQGRAPVRTPRPARQRVNGFTDGLLYQQSKFSEYGRQWGRGDESVSPRSFRRRQPPTRTTTTRRSSRRSTPD